jgi:hypothetical protein
MGQVPIGCSLERKNSNGHYTPKNCKWATLLEQNNNRRTNRLVLLNGKQLTAAQASRAIGKHVHYVGSVIQQSDFDRNKIPELFQSGLYRGEPVWRVRV